MFLHTERAKALGPHYHPDGAAAGVTSLQQAWDAVQHGETIAQRAAHSPELRRAIEFFGKK